jgi:hypothetical protein
MCPWRFAATSAMAFQQWSWTASSTDLVWLGEQCMPKTVCWADPKGNRLSIEYNQKKTESQKMTRSNPMYGWIFQGHWPKPPQNQLSPENSGPLK